MTTEQEFLGNAPRSGNAPLAPSSAAALQDAAALYERARLAADSGETLEALTIGAEAVGMSAVAADLERREAAAMVEHPSASRTFTERGYKDHLAGSQDAARLALVMDGGGSNVRPVSPAVTDYVESDPLQEYYAGRLPGYASAGQVLLDHPAYQRDRQEGTR